MSERRERPRNLTARCNVFCSNKLPAVNIVAGVMSTLQIIQTPHNSVDSNYYPFMCIGAHLEPRTFCDLAMFRIDNHLLRCPGYQVLHLAQFLLRISIPHD